jgi:protein-S-isoprenylcysteine O-methyltransferase Ste14
VSRTGPDLLGVPWRWFDLGIGLSVLSWAVLGMLHAEPVDRWSAPRLTITGLDLLVGGLLLARAAPLRSGSLSHLAAALPAFLVGGTAVTLAPPLGAWPWFAAATFVAGAAAVALSFGFLGRNFAILPARRALVTAGPYRLIRHPAYAGELLMVLACALAAPSWPVAALAMAAVPLVVLRIVVEERVLAGDAAHAGYCARVPWRLVPGLW